MQLRPTKGFAWFLAQLDADARDQALAMAREAAEEISGLQPGAERARAVHRRVSQLQEAFLQSRPGLAAQVQCRKGCSACCRMWVGITSDEAALLGMLVRQGAVIDRPRLAVQANCRTAAEHFLLGPEQGKCVFLDKDGACTIHEERPSACRVVLVASDPALCGQADLATQIAAVIAPDAELLATAALSEDSIQGSGAGLSLASGLARELEQVSHPFRS